MVPLEGDDWDDGCDIFVDCLDMLISSAPLRLRHAALLLSQRWCRPSAAGCMRVIGDGSILEEKLAHFDFDPTRFLMHFRCCQKLTAMTLPVARQSQSNGKSASECSSKAGKLTPPPWRRVDLQGSGWLQWTWQLARGQILASINAFYILPNTLRYLWVFQLRV